MRTREIPGFVTKTGSLKKTRESRVGFVVGRGTAPAGTGGTHLIGVGQCRKVQ